MRLEKRNFTLMDLTIEDRNAILRTMDILDTLNSHYTIKANLTSVTTGEVIETKELPRVRGILSGLMDNEIWKVDFDD